MKATELRIGNIVEFMGMEKVIDIEIFKDIDSNYATASPIKLSKEWLIKFGFTHDEDSWYYSLDYDSDKETFKVYLRIDNDKYGVINVNHFGLNLEHIHQLQNLYFALTGKELI